MSIKKSLRLTFFFFTVIPLLIIVCFFNRFLGKRNNVNLEKTTQYQILTRDGVISYSGDNSNYDALLSIEKIKQLFSDYENDSNPAEGNFTMSYHNQNYKYSYSFFKESNQLLLMSTEVPTPLDYGDAIHFLLLAVLAYLPCYLILDYYFQTRLVHPILDLRHVLRTASAGNLNVVSSLKSTNELGDLSRNLNKMLHIIKGNYDELATMHEQLIENEDALRSNYNRIEHIAYHDGLTDLPNRLAFLEFTNAILKQSEVATDHHAMFFIDLDNFKLINDTLGHDYGDRLLVHTAKRLISLISENDCIARAGGDEFMIMKPHISSKEEAIDFALHILDSFKKPFVLDNETAYISLSIGIALYPENGLDTTSLTKNADIAMYNSKENGKNKYSVFDSEMEEKLNYKSLITDVLRYAIRNNEIYLLYQPQIRLKDNQIIGYEALLRVYHPRMGLLSPREFIPVAEETGLINELGDWVLRKACQFNKSLIDNGISPYAVSVNISPVQINHYNFFNTLSQILEETQLPPQYLELELTESTLVSSIIDTATIIKRMQEIGVKVALDDFGTGYSSLNYLAKMNIHTLKIDKSFINNICVNDKELSMVHTIIRLAHHLGIQVVAEGVEHPAQLVLLKEIKCDIVQGFVFSQPLLSNDLMHLLQTSKH